MYKKVSVIVPIFNERLTIHIVLDQLRTATTLGLEKEIILVDDHSTDGTAEFLQQINEPHIKVFLHDRNKGKGASLQTGFQNATGDIIVIQDADLEYDPTEIQIVMQPFFDQQAKVVYGSRYLQQNPAPYIGHSFFNKIFSKLGHVFIRQKVTDIMTCYKAFDAQALMPILSKLESQRFGFEPEVTVKISRAGFKIFEVPISYHPRSKRQGKHMDFHGQVECLWALIKYSLFVK